MGEVASTFSIEYLIAYTKCLEESGQDDSSYAVDGVGADAELAFADGLYVGQLKLEHGVYMALVAGAVGDDLAHLVYFGIVEVFVLGYSQYLGSVGGCKELSFLIKQFQGVPLAGIVRCGDDDTTVSLVPTYCQFCGRGGCIADVNDIIAHANKGSADHITNHGTADTAVASDNDFTTTAFCVLPGDKGGVCCGEFNNV